MIMDKNQTEINYWKDRFELLDKWDIRYVVDGKNFCTSRYDAVRKRAIIYMCDIDQEENYLLSQVLKIAYIEARLSPGNADKFLEDLTTLILARSM
jgi:hypothetical protein